MHHTTAASPGRSGAPFRWAATIVANVVSVGVFDAVVAGVGGLFVAWEVFGTADRSTLGLLVVASYLVWAVGLRANLQANAELLRRTGTSTDAVSKAAFDLARRRYGDARRCRWASHAGYLATELGREVPFFLAAFGTAGLSDRFDERDALVFLVGSNAAAAVCELGLAAASRAYLARRPLAMMAA